MAKCTHQHIAAAGPVPFSGPVSRDENRAAHGWAMERQTCMDCGAERRINFNQSHEEIGPWQKPEPDPKSNLTLLAEGYRVNRKRIGMDSVAYILRTDGTQVVVGLNLADAVRRLDTADADVIRAALEAA